MHDITVSSLEHIGPLNIINLEMNIPNMHFTLFQAQESL